MYQVQRTGPESNQKEESLGDHCSSTLSLLLAVMQSIFLPETDAERRWGNPISSDGLGLGLHAEEILAPPDALPLIIDLLWPLILVQMQMSQRL